MRWPWAAELFQGVPVAGSPGQASVELGSLFPAGRRGQDVEERFPGRQQRGVVQQFVVLNGFLGGSGVLVADDRGGLLKRVEHAGVAHRPELPLS